MKRRMDYRIKVFPDRTGKPDNPTVIIETREQLSEYVKKHCTKWADVRSIVKEYHDNNGILEV